MTIGVLADRLCAAILLRFSHQMMTWVLSEVGSLAWRMPCLQQEFVPKLGQKS